MSLLPDSGDSAEDQMSKAFGCIAITVLVGIVAVVGIIGFILWKLLT